jgi:hypothetical protein
LNIELQEKTGTHLNVILQAIINYLYFAVSGIPTIGTILFWISITPLILLGSIAKYLPTNITTKDNYFHNVVLAAKL